MNPRPPRSPSNEPPVTDGIRTVDVPVALGSGIPLGGIPLGAFTLLTPLAKGGMAEVWRGAHRASGMDVAIKVVQGKHAGDPRFIAAFNDEARLAAGLDHTGIVTLFDYGRIPDGVAEQANLVPGTPYLVMEYAGGLSLDRATVPMRWQDLESALIAILDALAHAHARGVLHLDLKPGNVLRLDPAAGGTLRLSDFGLARAWREAPAGGLFGAAQHFDASTHGIYLASAMVRRGARRSPGRSTM